jgi:nucleotide-binding universal stress UspA family protein
MYKKILAAVNEFTNSEIAARYAIALAKSCQAQLSLVFVAEDKLDRDVLRRAESSLESLFIEAQENDIEVESITEVGSPLKKIGEIVGKNNVDIVFISTRREDVQKRFFVSTLAREFTLKLPCSVAMVRVVRMGRIHPRNILVPLRSNMTNLEERAYFVAKLAHVFDSAVTLFHSPGPITSFFHGEIQLKPAQREQRVSSEVEKFMEYLKMHGINHEERTAHGGIARAITIEAAHRRNDLILMGASERGLLRSIISSNPVEDVLRETPCNLIILRPKHEYP